MRCAGGPAGRVARPRGVAARAQRTQALAGLEALAGRYDVWLLDQFGVLHDGRDAYPGAVDAVAALAAEQGARLVIISNSSRRSATTVAKLATKGFAPEHFAGAVTSGELTWGLLERRDGPLHGRGDKALHMTWNERGAIDLGGLGLDLVDDPAACDFILAHGTEAVGAADGPRTAGLDELFALLEACASRPDPPPLVCANPDFVTVDKTLLVPMPGQLASRYAELGGPVTLMGKPDPRIYDACARLAGEGVPRDRFVAVGDSLHHDVAGAAAAGFDSVLVTGGVHADELTSGTPDPAEIEALAERLGTAAPTYAVASFAW